MDTIEETFTGELWESSGKGAWYFITLPENLSARIRFFNSGAPGFGSVRVSVTIGGSTWQTSIFPDRKRGSYLLPVIAAIRHTENINKGDMIPVCLVTL